MFETNTDEEGHMTNGRNKRQTELLKHLGVSGTGSIDELCKKFEVSEMTIRRDLSELQEKGLLIRTHGGAKLTESTFFEISFSAKENQFVQEKMLIAECASSLIRPNDRIVIDSGTTAGQLTRYIKDIPLSVITNALNVATDLIDCKGIDLHICGGSLRRGIAAAIGPLTVSSFESFRCDRLFMGLDGIDISGTMTVPDMQEAEVKQAMIKMADEVIVLADQSKLGRNSLGVIGQLSSVDTLITGPDADPEIVAALSEQTKILIADTHSSGTRMI